MNQILEDELKLIYGNLENIIIHYGNPIVVIINKFILPPGFKKNETQLLLKIPISYPLGKPDMFWVDEEVVPKEKKLPFNPSFEIIYNKNWLRYSWHLSKWNPSTDNILTYLEFIADGLKRVLKS